MMELKDLSKAGFTAVMRSHGWAYLAPMDGDDNGFRYPRIRNPGDKGSQLDSDHYEAWGKFRFTAYKLNRVARHSNWIGD